MVRAYDAAKSTYYERTSGDLVEPGQVAVYDRNDMDVE